MIADISLIVTAIGVLGAMISLRQSYLERLRQFELKYIDRYWSIIDRLSFRALSVSDADPTEDEERAIRSYFYLCEDEFDMRRHGYISDDTYWIWAPGIKTQLQQPMFSNVWDKVVEEAKKDKRGHRFVNLHDLLEKENFDPLSMSVPAKYVRGLIGIRHLLGLAKRPSADEVAGPIRAALPQPEAPEGTQLPA